MVFTMRSLLRSVHKPKAQPAPRSSLRCSETTDILFHYPTVEALQYDLETIKLNFDYLYDLLDALRIAKAADYVRAMLMFKHDDSLMQAIAHGDIITLQKTGLSSSGPVVIEQGLSISRHAVIELVLCSAMLSNEAAGLDLGWGFVVIIIRLAEDKDTVYQEIMDAMHQAYAFACVNDKWTAALRMFLLYDNDGNSFNRLKTPHAQAGHPAWEVWAKQLKECKARLSRLAADAYRCPACSGRVLDDFSEV
jgi:hypothetical protein